MFSFLHDAVVDVVLSIPLIGAYVIFALGIVVIFRASRVLNLAHGAMAMAPAYISYQLSTVWHLPVLVGLVAGVASGGALGYVVERCFVRPLRRVSPTAQTVGTVAAFGLIVALVAKLFGTLTLRPRPVFPAVSVPIGATTLSAGAVGLFVVGAVVAAALYAFFTFTDVGLAMRAAADNRRAAGLMGVDPQRTTTLAWVIGGATAALAGILLGAATTINPYNLSFQALPAFVTVLIGGLESLLGAIGGGVVVGALTGLVPLLPIIGDQQGAPQLMLMVVAFVVMAARGSRLQASDVRGEGIASGTEPPSSGPTSFRRRLFRGDLAVVGTLLALVFPALPFVGSNLVGDANVALEYAVVGVSLVLLIGLVGQISLAHASFVGIGAFTTGLVITHLHVPFPANLPIAAGIAAVCATLLGVVALRVRGLYLAVATLIFAWMCDAYLFQQSWLVGVGGSQAFAVPHVGVDTGFPSFDFTDRRTFYYVALAAVGIVVTGVALLRRSKTGRAFFAVRGSEVAAASLGIDVVRYKLLAFGLSGAVAGMAGNLIAANSGALSTGDFTFTVSLFYLSIAVVGGLTSTGGAVAAGLLFAALHEVFFQVDALAGYLDVVSSGLLITVLLVYPGGLAALPASARALRGRLRPVEMVVVRRIAGPRGLALDAMAGLRRGTAAMLTRVNLPGVVLPVVHRRAMALQGADGSRGLSPRQRMALLFRGATGTGAVADSESNGTSWSTSSSSPRLADLTSHSENVVDLPVRREDRLVLLSAEGVSMRFGGLLAVDSVTMSVREGEIVGLIGPNGAGKTTTFNCISGLLVPTSGGVTLFGCDVTSLPVHERARMGLGRTFQVIQLFPQLTVFDNLLVATHGSNPTGVLAHLAVTRRAVSAEAEAREWVGQVVELLDLTEVADRPVAGLPFGVLRMVEVARAIVTGARLVMLDEPASGLDNTETQRLAELLLTLRAGLGLTLLLIEHDVKMVTSVSDYMYVLDRGRLLAEGTPAEVQSNRDVIAAYLGEPAVEVVA